MDLEVGYPHGMSRVVSTSEQDKMGISLSPIWIWTKLHTGILGEREAWEWDGNVLVLKPPFPMKKMPGKTQFF